MLHEDDLSIGIQSAEAKQADDKQRSRPIEKGGIKPTADTLLRLKQLRHQVPNSTKIHTIDPKFNSLKRWVGLDEKGDLIYLYRKPSINELKYGFVVENNPYFKNIHSTPSKPLVHTSKIHDIPIPKPTLDYPETVIKRKLVSFDTPQVVQQPSIPTGRRLNFRQTIADKPAIQGRRLDGSLFSRDDAILSAKASNTVYGDNEAVEGFVVGSRLSYELTDTKIVVFKSSTATIISIRGTKSALNWATNLLISFKDYNDYKAHLGYSKVLETPIIKSFLLTAIRDTPRDRKLIITGHSMGGGIAMLIRLLFKEELDLYTNLRVYTYGQPAVLDDKGANYYNSLSVFNTFRVFNPSDHIPYTPLYPFTHAGTDVVISKELFMINPNNANDIMITTQALFNAFFSPFYVSALDNIERFKRISVELGNRTARAIDISQASGRDYQAYETEIAQMRGVRRVDKDAMRLASVLHQIEAYKANTISVAQLEYRQSIGAIMNTLNLRNRPVNMSRPLTRAETDTLTSIEESIRTQFDRGELSVPSALVAEEANLRNVLLLSDKVMSSLNQICRYAPYGITALQMWRFIVSQHTMDNYLSLINGLPNGLGQTSTLENIFNTVSSVITGVFNYMALFTEVGMPIFGGGSNIPFNESMVSGNILSSLNTSISQAMLNDPNSSSTSLKDNADELENLKSMIGGNIESYDSKADVCSLVSSDMILGLVEYDSSLNTGSGCIVAEMPL